MDTTNAGEASGLDGTTAVVYGLAVASAGFGGFLAIQPLIIDLPRPVFEVLFRVAVVSVGLVPAVFGFLDRSFVGGLLAGSFPFAGVLGASASAWYGARLYLSELVGGLFIGFAVALPVAGLLYIVGVALRRDGSVYDRSRELAAGMAVLIVLAVMLWTAVDVGVVNTPLGDE
jgi:hypothetical protein